MTTPARPLSRRSLLLAAGAVGGAALVGCAVAQPRAGPGLRLLGQATLRHRLQFRGSTVGGLSALDFDPASGLWMALSDDRSEHQPARAYTLSLDVGAQDLAVELLDRVTLRQADGQPYPPRRANGATVDPEALRLLPNGRGFLWASEGEPRVAQPPSLHQARLDGSHVRDFSVPAPLQGSPDAGSGPRDNNTFEGLALTPDGRTAWVAMEGPLQQDGPLPQVGALGGPCRFTAFDLASGRAVRQLAYQPDAIPHPPLIPGGFADNGVSEVLMLDAERMLVMERAYAVGSGVSLRLYQADLRNASNTLLQERLVPGAFQPMRKRLVANLAGLGLSRLDNTEGMCWGPPQANGHRTLVVVSDDNFNPMQVTQFAAFDYLE